MSISLSDFGFILLFVALAGEGNTPTPAQMELQLVQSKADIEKPPLTHSASAL